MNLLVDRLREVLLESETVAVRLFLGAMALGYAAYMPSTDYHPQYYFALQWVSPYIWSTAFFIHGAALIYGVMSKRYSFILLLLEGVLGSFTWVALGIATSISSGVPGPTLAASFVAGWVLVRYPSWK